MKNSKVIFLNKFAAIGASSLFSQGHETYSNLVRFFETGIVDRTRSIDAGFDYHPLDPLPLIIQNPPDFETLMLERALEIVQTSINMSKPLLVLWSGGIDSTAVLLALKEVFEKPTEQLVIGCTAGSFVEFPELGQELQKAGYRMIPLAHPVSKYLPHEYLLATGEHGDQLFGSDKMLEYVAAGLGHMPYRAFLPFLISDKMGHPQANHGMMEMLDPIFEAAPFPLKTLCDALWWMNFTLKWQQVTLRIPVWSQKDPKQFLERCHHFYRSVPFQQWSMMVDHKDPRRLTDYKLPLKKFIQSRFPCPRYTETKSKEISLRPRPSRKWWELTRHRWSFVMRENWQLEKEIIPHYLS